MDVLICDLGTVIVVCVVVSSVVLVTMIPSTSPRDPLVTTEAESLAGSLGLAPRGTEGRAGATAMPPPARATQSTVTIAGTKMVEAFPVVVAEKGTVLLGRCWYKPPPTRRVPKRRSCQSRTRRRVRDVRM